jgi:hypothetical protein
MKRAKVGALVAMAAAAALAVMPAKAETFKKLHSAVQRIVNSTVFNDTNEPTSSTIDLSGGDLDKCSFAVYGSSATSTSGTLSLALQISPDGTTWIATGDTITVATSTTLGAAISAHADNLMVSPGTKARLLPTLTGNATYYGLKVWAVPSVD